MTPKEKAIDLWLKYYELLPDGIYSTEAAKAEAKRFALIAVDEIIDTGLLLDSSVYVEVKTSIEYWQKVKTEIEAL